MNRIRFGTFVPPHHLPVNYNPTYALQRDVELVQLADSIGFDEAWFGEHHSGGAEPIGDPLMFMCHVAAHTKHIRLGAGVVSLPYHNPLWVVDRLAMLDHLTRGRIMLGLGPGALVSDAAMVGIHPSEQRDALEQDTAVLMHLMTSEEPLTIETPRYKLVNAKLQLDFYQDPHPEVAAAAIVSPSGPRLAGTYGGGLLSIGATMKAGVDVLAMHWKVAEDRARECGKTMDRKNWRLVGLMHLAATKDQAIKDVAFGLREFCDYLQHTSPTPQFMPVGSTVSEYIDWAMSTGAAVIGTYEEAIEQIEALQELSNGGFGCYMLFDHNWAPWAAKKQHYEIFGEYVIPHFKRTNRRLKQSENDARIMREQYAAEQKAAVAAFTDKYGSKPGK